MKRIILTLFLGLAFILISCCNNGCVLPKPNVSGDPVLIQKLLTESVDSLSDVDNGRYYLDAHCWRDFMPTTGECDYKGLLSSITVKDTAGKFVPTEINVVKHYVIYKDSVWISNVSNKNEQDRASYIIDDGPKWPVDSLVQIVTEVNFKNVKKYLIHRNAKITRVD